MELGVGGFARTGRLVHSLLMEAVTTSSVMRPQELEHALVVLSQHLGEIAWHWIGPEKVVVQSGVRVDALGGVEREQLVEQVTGIGIPYVGLQTVDYLWKL